MFSLLNLILLLPFCSFVLLALYSRSVGIAGAMFISCINIIVTLCASCLLFWVSFNQFGYVDAFNWVLLNGSVIGWDFRFDALTVTMFIVVSAISTCVHIYSCVYMYGDPFLSRFLSYLSLFTGFMLILVSANNFLVLFVGWEGLVLCSYLLIGFWHTRVQAGKAATKAFLMNKVGDLFLLGALSILFRTFLTLDISVISLLASFVPSQLLEVSAIFLFIGAVGKSAQIGLHSWLPDAMEGPTPVSALIHAATMVTAGVFLLLRVAAILEEVPAVLVTIMLWGGVTALVAGIIGSVQNDIKKIIAYSTCGQLGFMVLACGLSLYNLSLFHLVNHAFFKALLFLSAGSIIHLLKGEQDIRKMGGLSALMPYVANVTSIASLALSGFPFLSGFFSKDIIIESALINSMWGSSLIQWLALGAASITSTYSLKLSDEVFWGDFVGYKRTALTHIQTTKLEIFILGILAIFSMFSGYFLKDIFSGLGTNYFNNTLAVVNNSVYPLNYAIETEFTAPALKILPVISTIVAEEDENSLESESKWYVNEIFNQYLVLGTLKASRHMFEQYEKRVFELFGLGKSLETLKKTLTLWSN